MLIMMKIIFADLSRVNLPMKWFSLYSPPVLWPLYGVPLYDVLKRMGIDVSIYSNDPLIRSIWRKRFGVKVHSKVSDEALIINFWVYGDLEKLLDLLNRLSRQDYKGDKLFVVNGSPAILYTNSGFDESDFNDLLNRAEHTSLDIQYIYTYENPWDLLKYFLNLDLSRVLMYIIDLFEFESLYDGVYVKGDVTINDRYTYVERGGGPILIFDDVSLEGFNVLKGPLVIGSKTLLLGSKASHSVIGPVCKIGSEVSDSIIMGYSNSAHHGYIGHSLVGYWVNVGAGTVFSDLKNTYGYVKFRFKGKEYDLGMIKFGSVVGDYVKISINTSIYGGRIVGLSSHVSGLIRTNIEPFTIFDGWSGKQEDMYVDKAIEIAERMYVRRGVKLLDEEKLLFKRVFDELKKQSR